MQTEKKRLFKNQVYEQFARIGKPLANPQRLELLDMVELEIGGNRCAIS